MKDHHRNDGYGAQAINIGAISRMVTQIRGEVSGPAFFLPVFLRSKRIIRFTLIANDAGTNDAGTKGQFFTFGELGYQIASEIKMRSAAILLCHETI
ncbi:MAG: hypothetical protein WA437_12060 [Candidatus Sulfotelmatobacter sp.]